MGIKYIYLRHPARTIPFRDLAEGLKQATEAGYVNENISSDGLSLYTYTQFCTYDSAWNEFTLLARGLVLDHKFGSVVATPFPKFFNAFEKEQTIPDLPFETFEKIDGSLIILFHWGEWRTITKGSFTSSQAKQAKELLKNKPMMWLRRDATYLLEYVAPDNRIVVGYPEPKLYLLSAYMDHGHEADYDWLCEMADRLGWEITPRRHFDSFSDVLTLTKGLPATHEGHVVRFENGLRLKIKGDEYCRIHSLISGVTPLGIWELMLNHGDLEALRRQLPEEFWTDFDQIVNLLRSKYEAITVYVKTMADSVAHLTDKEVGLRLNEFPADVRRLIFPYRKAQSKLRETIFRDIRPASNYLSGYVPSYSMNRVADDNG